MHMASRMAQALLDESIVTEERHAAEPACGQFRAENRDTYLPVKQAG